MFELPADLRYNRAPVRDPSGYMKTCGCRSWLYLVGEEFAAMPDGMSFEQVRLVTPHCINVVSDPPRVLNVELAREHVRALDELPRPTLISCRAGPRASAVAYMYAGVKRRAEPEDVLAAALRDSAPFCTFEEYRDWVSVSIQVLTEELA